MVMAMASVGRRVKLHIGVFQSVLTRSSVKATSGNSFHIQSRLWPRLGLYRVALYSTKAPSCGITVQYKHGRPMLTIPLPSRRKDCRFSLRPLAMTVGNLIQDIQREDPAVTEAAVLSAEGELMSSTTSLETVLRKDFQILINDLTYYVHSSVREFIPGEHRTHLEDIKDTVHTLHTALHLPRHQQLQERELLKKLDELTQHLRPLEEVKNKVERRAEHMCSWAMWSGLAVLSLQGGLLAWFTWWVYSWDIMEPITYFLTCTTSIGFFSYFILTKQDFSYSDVKDRQFLHYFYEVARREGFEVHKYNKLKEEVALVEENLRRLRKSKPLGVPVEQLQPRP